MNYILFMDESGDHGLVTLDPNFPVFLLCGVLISEDEYDLFKQKTNKLKFLIWGEKQVIFHSRDIRKCEKEFQVLFNMDIKELFYRELNKIIKETNFTVFASAIRKDNFIKKYGRLSNDVYELALSFIVERTIFYFDDFQQKNVPVQIIIEKRGKNEDKKLDEHFQRLLARGTGFVASQRLLAHKFQISFKSKIDNINGLQLADLMAYPIARFVISPDRANPAFDIINDKVYSKNGKRYGLKIFP
jgi:hypothetical protein